MCVAIVIGIPLGVVAATHRNGWVDYMARTGSLIGVSFPVFWLGLLALATLYYRLGILPGPGRLDSLTAPPPQGTGLFTIDGVFFGRWDVFVDAVRHLILPAFVLGAYAMGFITRITRASMLDALGQDFVRTAHAKGLDGKIVVIRHVLRNAAIPTITMIGLMFGNLMSGAVVTETVFAWPGIGRYAVYAASRLDYPSIMGVTLLVALAYVTINFLVDLTYAVVDPRIRLD
jgi:peptide/nickel transport system permease protein